MQNPFGDAKPREAVLASRTGKSEAEILVEEVKAEKPKVQPGCVWVAAVNRLRVWPSIEEGTSRVSLAHTAVWLHADDGYATCLVGQQQSSRLNLFSELFSSLCLRRAVQLNHPTTRLPASRHASPISVCLRFKL